MLRKLLIVAALAAVVAVGCERKSTQPTTPSGEQPGQGQPQVQQPTTPSAPEGMALIEGVGEGQVYIRTEPVTVVEYVEFFKATGRDVPQQYSGSGVDTDQPVTGLTLRQARQLATWKLGKLPTANEWRAAPDDVVSGSYPWRLEQGEDAPRPGAKVYIVKHYKPGSSGEQQAKDRRDEMMNQMLSSARADVQEARQNLQGRLGDLRSKWQTGWKKYKTLKTGDTTRKTRRPTRQNLHSALRPQK